MHADLHNFVQTKASPVMSNFEHVRAEIEASGQNQQRGGTKGV